MLQPSSSSSFMSPKKQKIIKWIRNCIDYSQEREQKPYSFYRDASFYDCQLPSMAVMDLKLRSQFIAWIVDEDMKSDLEDSRSLNWFSQAVELLPVNVPKDGNCLLHAASMAVWSVEDSLNTLRDLMLMTIKINSNIRKRWCSQLKRNLQSVAISQPKAIDEEWDDVIRSISDLGSRSLSKAVPHRFLEGVHIYILANILRRPIIVITNGPAKSFAGVDLQDNYIGGLYLPLEWQPIACCKTPIILGYSYSHFCPLLSEMQSSFSSLQQTTAPLMFPLVHSDLSSLIVRFLKEEEENTAWDLVQTYLAVKEMDIVEASGAVTKVPFTQLHINPLDPKQNTLFDNLVLLKTKLKDEKFLIATQGQPNKSLPQQSSHPFYDIEMNSQTEVVPVRAMYNKNPNKIEQKIYKHVHEANRSAPERCIFEGCFKEGNPNLDNFCQDCFKILSEAKLSVPLDDQMVLNAIQRNQAALENRLGNTTNSEITKSSDESLVVVPTAPLLSLEQPSPNQQPLSMMEERCINKCGYRCSDKTYPYCHECFQKQTEKRILVEQNSATTLNQIKNSDQKMEAACKGNEDLMNRATRKRELDEMYHNVTPISSSLSSEHSTLSSFNYNLDDLVQINEGYLQLSLILNDVSSNNPFIAIENPNCINFEQCTGQKMLDHNLCNNCAEREKENEKSNKRHSNPEPSLQTIHQESNQVHNRISHVKQTSEANAEQINEGFAESLAENNLKGSPSDVEVSEEPITRVKCSNPYCDVYILPPEKLCDICKDILKKRHEQTQKNITNDEHLTGNKVMQDQKGQLKQQEEKNSKAKLVQKQRKSSPIGKPCISRSCSNYGDPQMDNMCSRCYFKSLQRMNYQRALNAERSSVTSRLQQYLTQQKSIVGLRQQDMSSQAMNNTNPVTGNTNRIMSNTNPIMSSNTYPIRCNANSGNTKGLSNKILSEAHLYKQPTHNDPPPQAYQAHYRPIASESGSTIFSHLGQQEEAPSLIITSKTGHNQYNSLHQLPPYSTYSFSQERDVEMAFENMEKNWKSSAKKCISDKCENYGNRATGGYCNACYKVYTRQHILEKDSQRGTHVPDNDATNNS